MSLNTILIYFTGTPNPGGRAVPIIGKTAIHT